MINLLPIEQKETLRKDYRIRIFAVALAALAALLFVANAVLLPSYFLSRVKLSTTQDQSDELQNSIAGKKRTSFQDLVATTDTRLKFLSKEAGSVSVRSLIRDVVERRGDVISLSDISYTQTGDGGGKLQVVGVAKNRTALIAYKDKLEADNAFSKVELPVSNLVSKRDIEFSMQLSISKEGGKK